MKKYVYKVSCNGFVANDLDTAVDNIIKNTLPSLSRVTAPIVSKVYGGYQVSIIDYYGNLYKRHIDVFEPASKAVKHYKVDECHNKYNILTPHHNIDDEEDVTPRSEEDIDKICSTHTCDNCPFGDEDGCWA